MDEIGSTIKNTTDTTEEINQNGATAPHLDEEANKRNIPDNPDQVIRCRKCGAVLNNGQVFCVFCGEKTAFNQTDDPENENSNSDDNENSKGKNKKRVKKSKGSIKPIAVVLIVVLALSWLAGIGFLGYKTIFSPNRLMSQGNYTLAYKLAKESQKEDI